MSGQSPSESGPRLLKLAVIATAAGAFSGLFGVGGGTVIVPLLVLWFGYAEHVATGTSLAAIVADRGCSPRSRHGAYGNVDLGKGLLVGVPGRGGRGRRHRAPAAPVRPKAVSLLFAARARRRRDRAADRLNELAAILLGFLGRRRRRAWWASAAASCSCRRSRSSWTSRQVEAEATSLRRDRARSRSSGTWRQYGYGNVRLRDALVIGMLSPLGVRGRHRGRQQRLASARSRSASPASSCSSRRSSCAARSGPRAADEIP